MYSIIDLSNNAVAKMHIRYMVGGHAPQAEDELIYRFEFPERLRHFADRSLERHFRRIGRSLAMMFVELRLEVPGIEMAHRSRAKNDQHLIRLSRVMRDTRSVGT